MVVRVTTPSTYGYYLIQVIKTLMADKYMTSEIAELTGLRQPTVSRYVYMLYRAKLVHIAGFGRSSRGHPSPRMKQWAWGPGEDAKYRKPTRRDRYLREKERRQHMRVPLAEKRALGIQVGDFRDR